MKRIILVINTFFILIFLLTACGSQKLQNTILNEIGIDVSDGNEISNLDTHGGFHGDGTTYIALNFADDKVLEQIKDSDRWKKFPLDETVETLVYGMSDETGSIGPFLTDGEGNALIPDIQDGYYLLIDRQPKQDGATRADILHRYSFNFTLGLYDVDTDTLYFCKLDT